MSEQLPFVKIPNAQWVDLYAATGIAVGTQLVIQNISTSNVKLTESTLEPVNGVNGYNIVKDGKYVQSAETPVGAWAYSSNGGRLQVEAL